MVEHNTSHGSEHESDGKSLNSILIRHSTAWFLLLLMLVLVWKMAQPIIGDKTAGNSGGESTATASQKAVATPSTTVAGTTATTVRSSAATTTAPAPPEKRLKLPSGTDRVQVMVGTLLMRSGPSTKNDVVGKLTRGTIVAVEGRENGWLKVRTVNDEEGYISGRSGLTRPAP